jgi:Caspase domain
VSKRKGYQRTEPVRQPGSHRASSPRHAVWLSLALLLLACGETSPAVARRLALVIGNDDYEHVRVLHNARADARAIAAELKTDGFDVTLKQDVTQQLFKVTLREFKARVQGGDEVVFYFSGHGVQFGGTNYLVPVDMTAESEEQVADDAIPLQRVLDDLNEQKARFTLAIIDACRNNPFKQTGRAIGGRGLAPVNPATGQMIMYSAGAGQEALDQLNSSDSNPNGVFTRVLIQEMHKPGVTAGVLLKSVQLNVVKMASEVHHEQVPALYDQSLGEFYFRAGVAGASAATGAAVAAGGGIHVPSAQELDESYWQRIASSTDGSDFSGYLASFPKGLHAAEAQMLSRKYAHPVALKAINRAPSVTKLKPGGPYPAQGTSNLFPGLVGTGTATVNADGSVDTLATNGDRTHATFTISADNRVSGSSITHLGTQNGMQRRYPDGSTSTRVSFEGQFSGGVIRGTYSDKFQNGTFEWTVGEQ